MRYFRYLFLFKPSLIPFIFCVSFFFFLPKNSYAFDKGIYLTQYTFMNVRMVKHLIAESNSAGVNTFVIDYDYPSKKYTDNLKLIFAAGIKYVARITMFQHGALPGQINDRNFMEKRYRRIEEAIRLGASEIQLDYIRYRVTQPPSSKNAQKIYEIIKHVRSILAGKNVKLQIDIFGVAAHKESFAIGQNPVLFAPALNVICPMVYPSHYEPFRYHAVRPYHTVYRSLTMLRQQLKSFPDVKIIAYIELFNYRFPMSWAKRQQYVTAQFNAVKDSDANGWYAWSANNHYRLLFQVMQSYYKK